MGMAPRSSMNPGTLLVNMRKPGAPNTLISQFKIIPVGPVANWNVEDVALRFVIVCTPSNKEKASGVTIVSGMFGPSGLASVTIAVTKSLVL